MSVHNSHDLLYTPRRAQKCLFGMDSNSNKKDKYKARRIRRQDGNSSEEESDLGPISPLAFTDQSPNSYGSSPKCQYGSPFTTPKKLMLSAEVDMSQDYLTSDLHKHNPHDGTFPFTALKKITRNARYSSRKNMSLTSPKSQMNISKRKLTDPLSLRHSRSSIVPDEKITETPQRHFGRQMQNDIVETPPKTDSSEYKLITPIGSENRTMALPKLHKRKSLNALDIIQSLSPTKKGNMSKRYACEVLGSTGSKLLKTDENCSIPKARAALFQEKKCEIKLENLILSTERFYSNSSETKRGFRNSVAFTDQLKKRSSNVVQTNNRRLLKRNKLGRINAGVSHAIKKPKLRFSSETIKKEIPHVPQNSICTHKDNLKAMKPQKVNTSIISIQRISLPEIDPNKRFFKTTKTIKLNRSNTGAVNNKLQLKVSMAKNIVLEQKNQESIKCASQKKESTDICFDTTDLTVDEPELEASIVQNKVANILKVLEEDWADDDYDSMEVLTNETCKNVISPLKSITVLNDVTMSPASELSNMTSTMNIEDIATPTASLDNTECNKMITEEKYYPLFNKGYSMNKALAETCLTKSILGPKHNVNSKSFITRGIGENQYQLDAGQIRFGATQCTECGVVYQLGDPEDENAHLNYHNNVKTLKFPGWKTEHVVMEDSFTSSRIILVEPEDSNHCWNKVLHILSVVDNDLGLNDTKLSDYKNKKVYLYIRDKSVLGVLVAECIETAHCMIPELLELDCCTAESTSAKCGINIIWTVMTHRRQGIATKLVDILRAQFYYGYIMSMEDIAFSIPTPSGKIFAQKYTKTRNFKVYN